MNIIGTFIIWKNPKKEKPKNNTGVIVSIDGDTMEAYFDGVDYTLVRVACDLTGYLVKIYPQAWAEYPKFNGVFSE